MRSTRSRCPSGSPASELRDGLRSRLGLHCVVNRELDLLVDELGSKACACRPNKSIEIDPETFELFDVPQGLKNLAPQLGLEVDLALQPVREPYPNAVTARVSRRGDYWYRFAN